MAQRANGLNYDFIGLRDGGDGVIGAHDKIIVKDQWGQRLEFYLGDEQVKPVLRVFGLRPNDLIGLPLGQAQGRMTFVYHLMKANALASSGDLMGLDEELRLAENATRLADAIPDPHKLQAIEELREQLTTQKVSTGFR